MVEATIQYEGGLHCSATHGPSGNVISTDAPVDNNGRGEAFSPTDLVATALATCTATIIGIVADRKELDVKGMSITVRKEMAADLPRRISRLEMDVTMPLAADHPERAALEAAGNGCPVKHSIHPDIEVVVSWNWRG
ncbi:MAG: OsmC family protein [Verrucomicrobiales bacterium]|nr:OsmC family protein [Verrucomicrobiota bacterium JB025]